MAARIGYMNPKVGTFKAALHPPRVTTAVLTHRVNNIRQP